MRKLFTKSLACVIALTLCLTAFVGAVSVSAATKNATITVVDQEITQGTETVTVPVTITCDADVAINEAILIISSDLGDVTAIADADVNDEAAVESVGDIKDKVFVAAKSEGYSVAKLNVTFAVAADKAVGDYNINIDVEGVKAADYSENIVTLVYDGAGKVSVVAEVVETSAVTVELYDMSFAEVLDTLEYDDLAEAISDAYDYACGVIDGDFYNPIITVNEDIELVADIFVPDFIILDLADSVVTYGDYSIYLTGEYTEVKANYEIAIFEGNPFVNKAVSGNVYTYTANTRYAINNASLTLGDQIFVNFTATANAANTVEGAKYGFEYYKSSAPETVYDVEATGNATSFKIQTVGIPAKELKVDFVARSYVEATVAGTTYRSYSDALSYNAVDYCKYVLDNAGSYELSFIELVKALLNYGAYAQEAFDFNTDDLANAILDEADKALPADFEAEYATKYLIAPKAVQDDLYTTIAGNGTIGTGYVGTEQTLVLLDSIDYKLSLVDLVNENTYKLCVWTYDEYLEFVNAANGDLEALSAAMIPVNCDKVVDVDGPTVRIPSIAVKNIADTLVVRLIEITPDDEMYFDCICAYSPISYAKVLIESNIATVTDADKTLCKYLAVYSEKARAYFGNSVI